MTPTRAGTDAATSIADAPTPAPDPRTGNDQQTAQSGRSSMAMLGDLMPFLRPYRWQMITAALALVVAACATLVTPIAFRQMIDLGFSAGNLSRGSDHVNTWFLALFGVSVVLAAGTAVRFYFVSWLGERVTMDLRSAVYRHVMRQDPTFFEDLKSGEVLSRLTADTTLIQTLVGTSVSLGLRNSLLFVGSIAMMMVTSPKLASLIVGLILLVVLPIVMFARRVRKLSRTSQDKLADASALAGERLNAIQTVQAFAREGFEADRFANSAREAFDAAIRRVRARSALTATAIVLIFGAIVFVLWMGAQAVIAGTMTGGTLTQFILYAAMAAGAVGALSEVLGDVQRAAGALERLLELLAARPKIVRMPAFAAGGAAAPPAQAGASVATAPAMTATAAAPLTRRGASLTLDRVSFHYPSRPAEMALDQVSIDAAPGETIAIVGPSGAGKTTLYQLILRFFDPQSGSLRLDGVDLRGLDPMQLRESIGLVAQDNTVFSADAMENIRYGRLTATDEQVVAAARAAYAHEFIERLPDGYRTFLGERGVRLSGGQRQRIAIARALLKNPPLLLLDEATSALDAESERFVQRALETAMADRTTLVIAHRLATVAGADRIIVLDHGKVVEQGTHQQLVALGGLYARLAAMQFTA